MATIIGIPPYAGVDKVDVSLEPITTLNGVGVALQHGQRFILAIRTAAGVVVDWPGDAAHGGDVDVTRLPIATTVTGRSVAVDAATGASLAVVNAARNGMQIWNDSTRWMIGKYDYAVGMTPGTTGTIPVIGPFAFRIGPNGQWEMPLPIYQGAITAIWIGAETDTTKTGANITETT